LNVWRILLVVGMLFAGLGAYMLASNSHWVSLGEDVEGRDWAVERASVTETGENQYRATVRWRFDEDQSFDWMPVAVSDENELWSLGIGVISRVDDGVYRTRVKRDPEGDGQNDARGFDYEVIDVTAVCALEKIELAHFTRYTSDDEEVETIDQSSGPLDANPGTNAGIIFRRICDTARRRDEATSEMLRWNDTFTYDREMVQFEVDCDDGRIRDGSGSRYYSGETLVYDEETELHREWTRPQEDTMGEEVHRVVCRIGR
jgi:hypothetical protein